MNAFARAALRIPEPIAVATLGGIIAVPKVALDGHRRMALVGTDSTHPFCPQCGVQFQPRRSNQRFCDRECQKASSTNAARGSQSAAVSNAAARALEAQGHRGTMLYQMLLRKHPTERPAFLDEIIVAARDHDWNLRRRLTDRRLLALSAAYGTSEWSRWAYIVQSIDQHCRLRWGRDARVFRVVSEDWAPPEPEAESVSESASPVRTDRPLPVYEKMDTGAFFRMLREDVAPRRFQPKETRDPQNLEAWQELMARSISGDPVKALEFLLVNRDPKSPEGYDWRRLAKALGDTGWQRYWRQKLIEDGASPDDLEEGGVLSPFAKQDDADEAFLSRHLA